MYAMRNKLNNALFKLIVSSHTALGKAKTRLREKDGSFFTENGLVIVIVVVIAIIIITAMVAIWNDTIIPGLKDKIAEFFGMA